MKQNSIMHALMCIFKTPSIKNVRVSDLSKLLTPNLLEIGFDQRVISRAIGWLTELTTLEQKGVFQSPSTNSTRVWSDQEYEYLGVEGVSYLTKLYKMNILDDFSRELLIDRLIALEESPVGLPSIKIVLMMILNLLPNHGKVTESFAGLLALEELSSDTAH